MKKPFPIKKLGSIAKITMGQSPQSKFYNQAKIGIPLIQGNADLKDGVTSPRIYTTSVTKKVEAGDIIMSVRAPVGELAISNHDACIGRGVCSIQAKNEQNLFLYYLLHYYRENITKYSQGSTFDSINSSDIQKVEVPYPTTEEQQKIASILSTWDEAISLYQNLKRESNLLYVSLRNKIFDVFSDRLVKMSLEDLEEKNIIELKRGKVISKKDLNTHPGKYPVYSSSVNNNGLFGTYGKYDFDEELVTWSVDGGGNFFYRKKHKYSITNVSGYIRVLDSNLIDTKFLYYYLSYLHQFENFDYTHKAHPSVIKKLYEVYIPSLEKQLEVVNVLELLENKNKLLAKMIDQLQEQKRGLMQLLLTGKVRV